MMCCWLLIHECWGNGVVEDDDEGIGDVKLVVGFEVMESVLSRMCCSECAIESVLLRVC